jgi:hypothetical protein
MLLSIPLMLAGIGILACSLREPKPTDG